MTVGQCNVDFLETCPLPHFWKKKKMLQVLGEDVGVCAFGTFFPF